MHRPPGIDAADTYPCPVEPGRAGGTRFVTARKTHKGEDWKSPPAAVTLSLPGAVDGAP